MEISSLSDLEALESQIAAKLNKLKLGDVLRSLHDLRKRSSEIQPFMIAGLALFAARFCPPSKASQRIKIYDLRSLVNLSNQYYFADPITFDQTLNAEFMGSNPVFMMLRLVSSQFPFAPSHFSEFSRPALLFHVIPKQLQGVPGIPEFDFESKFQAITGASVLDFITTGFVIYAASHSHFAVSHNYFKQVRKKGINIPDDHTVRAILSHLAADKSKLIEVYEKRKNQDRRFRMYDFNPLLSYPIVKPCQDKQFSILSADFIHAPVPELVGSRISTRIFYQMYNAYTTKHSTEFSDYFGHVFERYVGLVLENSITTEELLSDSDIRSFYPTSKGKAPDWILIDGSTAVLFECKATRFSRAAQAIANENAINSSLAQVKKGLKQLASFITACQSKILELQKLHGCTTFKPILVSLEPMELINSTFFREHIDKLLADENVTGLDWQIVSIDELEAVQPHVAAGFKLVQILDDLSQRSFNDVLRDISSQTKRTYVDSFLYQQQEEL